MIGPQGWWKFFKFGVDNRESFIWHAIMKKSYKPSQLSAMLSLFAPATVLSLAPVTSDAAGFIKFDGIDGESVDKDHKGWVDVQSFS